MAETTNINARFMKQTGFPLISAGGICVKGYIFDENSCFYEGQDLLRYFEGCRTGKDFEARLKKANGCFWVTIDREDEYWAACDRVRSFPLFYAGNDKTFYISDDPGWIRNSFGLNVLDPLSEREFSCAGYVTGSETLYQGLKQIQAGEWLCVSKRNTACELRTYYLFQHQNFFEDSESVLVQEFDAVLNRVGQRLVCSLKGRQAVVALSGGFDSRLIACLLKRYKYPNVFCFTYGRQGAGEVHVSRQVAQKLGYAWEFIPYTNKDWGKWSQDAEFRSHIKSAANFTATVYAEDWPAVRILKEKRTIDANAVLLSGHSGDVLEGSHVPALVDELKDFSARRLFDEIYWRHYTLWKKPLNELRALFDLKVASCVRVNPDLSPSERTADAFDGWDWRERQAKFIVNFIRTYDSHQLEWRLPLWDAEFSDFWSKVPVRHRFRRRLYRKYAALYQKEFKTRQGDLHPLVWAMSVLAKRMGVHLQIKFLCRQWGYLPAYFNDERQLYGMVPIGHFYRSLRKAPCDISSFMAEQYIQQLKTEDSSDKRG